MIRDVLSSDAFVAFTGIATLTCAWLGWRTWRSPHSWHIDGDSKQLVFHAWPEIAMATTFGTMLGILTYLTS